MSHRLAEAQGEDKDQCEDVKKRNVAQPCEVAVLDIAVDGNFCEIRLNDRKSRAGKQTDNGQIRRTAIRLDVAEKTPHQPRVVGLPEYLFFVEIYVSDISDLQIVASYDCDWKNSCFIRNVN